MPLADEPRGGSRRRIHISPVVFEPELGRALVVDDDRDFATELAQRMNDFGLVACVESDAEAALRRLFGEAEYRMLICDHHKAGLTGPHLIRRIKTTLREPPTCVLVTGQASFGFAWNALRCGADDFISKPLDPDELEHAIVRHTRGLRV